MSSPAQPVEDKINNNDAAAAQQSFTACPNCRTEMPGQMRFCRQCGYRLGEGVAEYAETVRFQQHPQQPGAARPVQTKQQAQATGSMFGGPNAMPGSFRDLNIMARGTSHQAFQQSRKGLGQLRRKCGRNSWPHWFIWPIIGIAVSVSAAGGNWVRQLSRQGPFNGSSVSIPQTPAAPSLPAGMEESVIGINGPEDAEGGASFAYVTPGSAADQAGLVGGDIIESLDGQPVKSADQLEDLLARTPVGKTVPVVFTRDGQTQTTKLRTTSEEENDARQEQFEESRETKGYIGEGTDLDRVRVPGMNIDGVQLGEIQKNNPAYIAGLRDGDIVIEFSNTPIRTRREFETRIQRALPGSTVKTVVVRDGQRLEIPVKVGQD
jgi:hypothetical protein